MRYDCRALGSFFLGDGWVLVGPAAFKAVVRRAERLGCVRFARISANISMKRRDRRRKVLACLLSFPGNGGNYGRSINFRRRVKPGSNRGEGGDSRHLEGLDARWPHVCRRDARRRLHRLRRNVLLPVHKRFIASFRRATRWRRRLLLLRPRARALLRRGAFHRQFAYGVLAVLEKDRRRPARAQLGDRVAGKPCRLARRRVPRMRLADGRDERGSGRDDHGKRCFLEGLACTRHHLREGHPLQRARVPGRVDRLFRPLGGR